VQCNPVYSSQRSSTELSALLAGAAHCHLRLENFRHVGGLGAFELLRQFGRRGRAIPFGIAPRPGVCGI